MLERLEELELLSYLKQTDKPQIHYLKSRVDSSNLFISTRYIQERKTLMKKQIDAVIKYAESGVCRSILLLQYFDEPYATKCGVCDVCIEERKREQGGSIAERIVFEIFEALSEKHLSLDELISSLHTGNEKERVDTLRNLFDAGKIKTDGSKYYL
jgi:ATP-dependent DNA helicase RecQ